MSIICEDGMKRYDTWGLDSPINITGNITQEIPEVIEDDNEEQTSSNSVLFIVALLSSLFLITSSIIMWVFRRKQDIETSPWEISGLLDGSQIMDQSVELDPQDVIDLLDSD